MRPALPWSGWIAFPLLLCACDRVSGRLDAAEPATPAFDGADARRPRIAVRLEPVASGFSEVTDVQFPPDDPDRMIVLEKGGRATWVRLDSGQRGPLFERAVLSSSELGLLGLAFHPRFSENGKIYVNYVPDAQPRRSRIAALTVDRSAWTAGDEQVLLEVEQPYANHDAGGLAFGPDGMLYVGWGDGGSGGDPQGNGQNKLSLLGSMLRLDVDQPGAETAYSVPADNPFVGDPAYRPEMFAVGLRNPWRISFTPDGRLVVADVGQNRWEEVDIVFAGANLGWNIREARSCFSPKEGCPTAGLTDPVYAYGREEGASITGGYVATGPAAPALSGAYVFGDFVSGRLWALDLSPAALAKGGDAPISSLGRWPLQPATFGRDSRGDLYVADFSGGQIYRIRSAPAGG